MGTSIDGEEGGVADGAVRLTDARGVLPGVHGGRGVDVQPASVVITVNIAVDVVQARKRRGHARAPDSAASRLPAFAKRCVEASRIMGRPFLTVKMFESTPCGLRGGDDQVITTR